ncbi:MAG TPA: hypothetical protein VMF69_16245 [Gemmataceae bacterium]|nr:hypothetical protein [Gemmataceae bacterium]
MKRMVVTARVSSDGVLHLHLPVGQTEADKEVQVTVETAVLSPQGNQQTLSACDLLHSGLVGMWAERSDIGDSREFARRLREQAQSRRPD